MSGHDYRCISQRMPEHCDCKTWQMIDRNTCLPTLPIGHCGCFFGTAGAPEPGKCCTCGAVNPYETQEQQ